jgi:2-isopropylmalate synthase
MSEKIHIFDTTLRDGEQSAGVAFTAAEKLEIARQLERLGVDVIEAGFPCSAKGDFAAVQLIAERVRDTGICALARAVAADVDLAWEAIRKAARPRIHVFINTSDIQIAHQLRKGRDEVLEQAAAMVRRAAGYTSDVEFSPMDATRSDRDFLCAIIEQTIAAGATTINVPDSVGYGMPDEVEAMFREIIARVPNIDRARLSFHGQNDLGMCTANSLAAVRGGARQIEVTINGIGERAGNTSLEEVVMAIDTRGEALEVHTDIDVSEIWHSSKLVERLSGMPVQWNKAVVGKNAFRHGSGIHQDGILKLRETWEIMDPKRLGIPDGTQLVLGKLSGRHAFRRRIEELGYDLDPETCQRAFDTFKELASKKVSLDDRDIEAIVGELLGDVLEHQWALEHVQVSTSTGAPATATLRLLAPEGDIREDAATGSGPVDALCKAMNRATGLAPELSHFGIRSVTEGIDAQAEVTVQVKDGSRTFLGRATDIDTVLASARAYLTAINRMITSSAHRRAS